MMGDISMPPTTRREAVAAIGAAAVVALTGTARGDTGVADRPIQTGLVSGVVFEDRSGTGRRQADDPGIAGVLVSNGREIARTDPNGCYRLPVEDVSVIFVVQPAGWRVRADADNLPRFTYIHQPEGTPPELGLRFRGIEPTGPLPASVDFGLTRADDPAAFDVILFTDPQPESAAELGYVRDTAIAGVLGTRAAFGLTTGDIMFDDLALYPRYNRLIGRVGIPWWHIGGNHDLNFEAPDAKNSRETFKRIYGAPYYAFHHGQALFLMLDNVRYLGGSTGPADKGGRYEGRFGERQLAFVANLLCETPPDHLVVVAMHIPLRTDSAPNDPANNTIDGDELLALLAGRPSFSVAGHTHTTEHHYLGAGDAHHHHVLTAVSGSWWSGPIDRRGIACADSRDGNPNGYHVLSIDGVRYTTRFVPVAEPERAMRICLESQFHGRNPEVGRDYTIQQLLGSPIASEAASATDLVVNVFDGGPKTTVTCRIGDRPPVTMTRVRRPDPFVEQVFARNAATKKPWVKAEPSTHIWTLRLPADLASGTHRAAVEVIDEYGRPRADAMLIEIVDADSGASVRRI